MKRPEAQDTGSIIQTGFDSNIVLNSIETIIDEHNLQLTSYNLPTAYNINNASWRVIKLILGNINFSNNKWWRINE